MRLATRAFLREAGRTPGYSLLDGLHGYIYARWPYLYVSVATREHPLGRVVRRGVDVLGRWLPRWSATGRVADPRAGVVRSSAPAFADAYHGKVMPLEAAKRLVTVQREIRLHNLEQVIPYAYARDILLQDPDHIVALECPCRAARPDPCQPLDVCLIVGEPFASLAAEHHPRRARWITQEEAGEILRAEHERGHVHHAFFKDAMLGRFYAICNCCPCCCGAMQAQREGTPMLASSGYVIRVDAHLCVACGACVASCPFGVLAMSDGAVSVDAELCMGCGVCADGCAQGALSLWRDASKSQPLDLAELLAAAQNVPHR